MAVETGKFGLGVQNEAGQRLIEQKKKYLLPGSSPGGSREIQRGDGFGEVDTIALIKY